MMTSGSRPMTRVELQTSTHLSRCLILLLTALQSCRSLDPHQRGNLMARTEVTTSLHDYFRRSGGKYECARFCRGVHLCRRLKENRLLKTACRTGNRLVFSDFPGFF